MRLATFLLSILWSIAAWGTPISVLYNKDANSSAERLDTAVQAAMQAVEERLIGAGLEVIQPAQATYDLIDKAGAGLVITFAPDAGWSLVLSIEKQGRPYPNAPGQFFAEIRMRARLYQGRRVLVSLADNAQVGYRAGNEDKAFEGAARRAAGQLAERLVERVRTAAPPTAPPAAAAIAGPQFVPSTGSLPSPRNRWALLFGVSDFTQVGRLSGIRVDALPGVVKDMTEMERLLDRSGVPAEQRLVLFNENATTAALRNALTSLRAKTAPDDVVMVYLSSHGMPKHEGLSGLGYPVTWDTNIRDRSTIIDFEEIRESLGTLPARQVVWIADTCHSGGAAIGLPAVEFSTRNITASRVHGLSPVLGAEVGGKDLVVVTSSRADQPSIDDNATGHGLFTFHLLRGLQQAIGRETIYQVFKNYIEPGVTAAARAMQLVQQPGFGRMGKGDLIVY